MDLPLASGTSLSDAFSTGCFSDAKISSPDLQMKQHALHGVNAKSLKNEMDARKARIAMLQGSHAVLRMNIEEKILGQFRRLPGIPSSRIGLETLTGRDQKFSYEDYLGDPEFAPIMHAPMDLHAEIIRDGF